MRDDVKRIIETGYDAMADRFADWQRQIQGSTRLERVEELLALLPERPDVLELGVGAGVRSTRMLAERGRLTGVDLSAEQLRRARERIPNATFLHADFTELELGDASFDAVVAVYVPQPRAAGRPRPAGRPRRALAQTGRVLPRHFSTSDNPGWRGERLGVEMFFAGLPPEENLRLVEEAGFQVLRDEIETSIEPNGEARFQWIWGRTGPLRAFDNERGNERDEGGNAC